MKLILSRGTLIDGTGHAPVPEASVIVEDGLNQAVTRAGEEVPAPPDAEVLDCTGKFILPGLIDSHVHLAFSAAEDHPTNVDKVLRDTDDLLVLRELRNAQDCLLAGITTVRDCGDRHNTTLVVRDALDKGMQSVHVSWPAACRSRSRSGISTSAGSRWRAATRFASP